MTERNRVLGSDDAVEEILREAPPRPMPSDEDMARVRHAVRAEWQAVSSTRRTRRRLVSFAAAAVILLAVGITVNVLRVPSALPVPVATIDKTIGSIYLLGEQSQLHETGNLAELTVGQTLVTGPESGVAVAWNNGGSLRVDQDTRVEFVSPAEILLRSGRVYFDSRPSPLQTGITQGSTSILAIRTEHGVLRHVGTQYMAGIDGDGLSVSVREGAVSIEGSYHDARAVAGQRLLLAGSSRPTITNISGHGPDWAWVEIMAPAVNIDKRSAYEFISWVGRESGLGVRFVSDSVERRAHSTKMTGTVDREPQVALRTLLQTTDLQSHVENGWIVISER